MKYIVMECHEAYVVLIDENSCFVKAANLNYNVGQTVENPIIMGKFNSNKTPARIIMKKCLAAAACLTLIASAGYLYYLKNCKAYSTILISSEADVKIALNKKGKVLYLESNNVSGEEIIKMYDGKGKDKITAANEILQIEIEEGYISDGDTVELYISTNDSENYDSFKNELEKEIPKSNQNLNVNVNDMKEYNKPNKPAVNENGAENNEPAATTVPVTTEAPPIIEKPTDNPPLVPVPPVIEDEKPIHKEDTPPSLPHDSTIPAPDKADTDIKPPIKPEVNNNAPVQPPPKDKDSNNEHNDKKIPEEPPHVPQAKIIHPDLHDSHH